jgi:hypothetical protein
MERLHWFAAEVIPLATEAWPLNPLGDWATNRA